MICVFGMGALRWNPEYNQSFARKEKSLTTSRKAKILPSREVYPTSPRPRKKGTPRNSDSFDTPNFTPSEIKIQILRF
ncbi:MAG: hypothetical protein IIU08_06070, partial [Clostridia bacterium]|nr:hypothetical protein [Clostridia bacterium]